MVETPTGGDSLVQRWLRRIVGRPHGKPTDRVVAEDAPPHVDVAEHELAQRRLQEIARLHEEDRLKTRLFSTAAHELNTPLTPVLMQVEMLKTPEMGPLTERQARAVALLERNLKRLEGLVHEILDVARLQGGQGAEAREEVALDTLLGETIESYRPAAERHGLQLDLTAARLTVQGDERRLAQVAGNLLSNAVKFTPAGGRIQVVAAATDDGVVVRVSDTGIGIAAHDVGRLFQPFVQLNEARNGANGRGTGLGLYISRLIVEAHGGHIRVASDGPGRGATFTVTLPRRRAPLPFDSTVEGGVTNGAGAEAGFTAARPAGNGDAEPAVAHAAASSASREPRTHDGHTAPAPRGTAGT